ncbi:hypothetical protein [Streptomyces sp. NPDC056160]|uniref:hypothetical protein n=1 Tax=Streptomyces sp. NPDC056160 TaxID=3345731 RepID=UPI0035DA746D
MRRTAFKGAAVAAAATAMLGLGLVQSADAAPASAQGCAGYARWSHSEVQVDNCPGDGAASWAWLTTQKYGTNYKAEAWFALADGSQKVLGVEPGKAVSVEYGQDIRQVQICEFYTTLIGWPSIPLHQCSNWYNV